MQRTRVATATRGAWAALAVLAFTLVPAAKAPAADGQSRILIPAAGWHGRPIQQPHNHTTLTLNRRPTGWSAGPVRLGTGLHSPRGSDRVRELQQRLRRLGYRPGAVDGIYGPRTRAAMGWFRRKHGFRVVGPPSLAAVVHLRERTTPRTGEPTPEADARAAVDAADDADGGAPGRRRVQLVAVDRRRSRRGARGRRTRRPQTPAPGIRGGIQPQAATGAGLHPRRGRRHVRRKRDRDRAGVRRARDSPSRASSRMSSTTAAATSDPGWPTRSNGSRPTALDCLVVGRIEQLADRQVDLHDVLARISRRGAVLVVLNVGPHLPPAARRWAPEAPRRVIERSDA